MEEICSLENAGIAGGNAYDRDDFHIGKDSASAHQSANLHVIWLKT